MISRTHSDFTSYSKYFACDDDKTEGDGSKMTKTNMASQAERSK